MQRRIERALFHLKGVFRSVLDDLRDGMSVGRTRDKSTEDQHIQRTLKHLACRFFTEHQLPSNDYGRELYSTRTTRGNEGFLECDFKKSEGAPSKLRLGGDFQLLFV